MIVYSWSIIFYIDRRETMLKTITKIFGTKNDREIKRIRKIVNEINKLEPEMQKLTDEELKQKTVEFRERLDKGETLDQILPEAFAVVREASVRVLGMRHYDVQLIGGIVLHEGKIAEMKTGEGKTLVATLAVYLNALPGKGVHVITVNDYLATRDSDLMGRIYKFLGLTVGVVTNGLPNEERKAMYACDILYGTNSEFGFDYLRDNMVTSVEQRVQRELNYAIVDEVDSILIDEARTPLIISGPSEQTTKWYTVFNEVAKQLVRSYETEKITDPKLKKEMNIPDEKWGDYEVDEKGHTIVLTEKGVKKVEKILKIDNLYSPEHVELTHYLNQALRAKELFKRDRDYLVRDGEVIIIDEFTGRALEGRRYSEGLHQAIEAKEGVNIAGENQTLASITLQNYFRMYKKLAGMTGTAETEAAEFMHTYKLGVVVIPTNKPVIREDREDIIYKTHAAKVRAIVNKIEELHKKGQPVLVGTISIANSEMLSEALKRRKIPHNVLNAKYHAKEAEIVAQAGRLGAVTIATNMAGRGTDIMLGGNPEFMAIGELGSRDHENYKEVYEKYKAQCEAEKQKVLEAGGLFILGTERHESRRIDNQLRGRSGRQGDPGASEFYLSLEDDLMRLFGSDRVASVMERLNIPEDEPITHPLISRAVGNAQKKVEARNFGIRKSLLQYDDVMNKQREAVYKSRNAAIMKDNLKETILEMLRDVVNAEISAKLSGELTEDWKTKELSDRLYELYEYNLDIDKIVKLTIDEIKELVYNDLLSIYELKEKEFGDEIFRKLERYILLEVTDSRWRENLKTLDQLKEGIHLRAYGQSDPLVHYQLLSSQIYAEMIGTIKEEVTSFLFKIRIKKEENIELKHKRNDENVNYIHQNETGEVERQQPRKSDKVGRNEPCPCGSGKKYKNCCGR
ncbi:MAG: preprotein translocase subunit SecA [Fusobacteriaceae bacterium]|nr:preprotein translocase subunit SecA [Fusobacteriaceae bacterium]